jgi:hypothetical protein
MAMLLPVGMIAQAKFVKEEKKPAPGMQVKLALILF